MKELTGKSSDERLLEMAGELQKMRLELEEQKRTVAKLKQELERQRGGENTRLVEAQIEQLFGDLAGPVSQLLTQNHLLKVEAKPVQANDILVVANRLIRALEDFGLTIENKVGDVVSFDPNLHEPLGGDSDINVGQAVTVRLVGVAYKSRLLRKAGVI